MLFVTFMLQDGNAWCGPLVHYHSGKEHTSISSWCFLETVIFDCNVDLPEAPFVFPCFSTLLMVKVMHGQASIWAISRLDLLVVNLDGGASHGLDGLDWLFWDELKRVKLLCCWHLKVAVWDHKLLGKFRFSFKLSKLPTWHPKITQKSCYRNGIGSTALHIAAANDEEEICKMILEDPRSVLFFFPGVWWHKKLLRSWEFDRIFDIIFRVQGGIPSKRWHMVQAIIFLGPSQASITRQVDPTFPTPSGLHPAPAWRMTTARRHWTTAELRKALWRPYQCILTAPVGSLARTLLLNLGMGPWKSWDSHGFLGPFGEDDAHSLGNLTGRFMCVFFLRFKPVPAVAVQWLRGRMKSSRHSIYF